MVLAGTCSLRQHESSSRKYFFDYSLRKLIIHAIRRLGYNCEVCHQSLDGPQGLFACSSYCNPCALTKFRRNRDPYVEGTIRFYL